ncbi:The GLUG motif-containing protein [Acetitomaculum ruminis DSM 5522]|uniref:The GLUG motif-containing protein n=1 Tax=Acetitomaculum ruminis DSM 5522 TaxID=1120918 RepID=A0A1I0WDE3_9FIRM|nr:GLUG motif-containing protein [Acetitomaculum ruminis]SFA86775.1 The GLUG motif-containing protein [Acetitomaculum ruminis DSM 5522]
MKNKTMSLLLSFIMIFSLFFDLSYQIVYAMDKGDGTRENPYKISNYSELKEFAEIVNGGHETIPQNTAACGILTNDIEGMNDDWIPIWNYSGIFDGNNKVISKLKISNYNDYIGFFGHIDNEGIVKNVSLKECDTSGNYYVGSLAGENKGIITNCKNYGNITGSNHHSGGIAGYNKGLVSNCDNYGDVNTQGSSHGGIVGDNSGTITNCHNYGVIEGSDSIGGVAGDNDGNINSCFNTGSVKGEDYIGGICGNSFFGNLMNSYNVGTVDGKYSIGGVVGHNIYGFISYCHNSQNISGNYYTGGITGWNENIITHCYNTKNVNGTYYTGGLVGWNLSSLNNSYNTGDVNVLVPSDDTYRSINGGLAGSNEGTITNCYNSGTIAGIHAGCLVGYNYNLLANSYSCGKAGQHMDGELVETNNGTMQNLYYDKTIGGIFSGTINNNGNFDNILALTTKEMTGKDCKVYESWTNFEDNWVLTDSYPVLKALTHKLEKINPKAASCTEDGNYEYYVCSYCGKYYKDEEATCEIQKDDFVLKATGHQWDKGIITKKATEKSTGIKTYTCSLCNAKKTEIIKKLSPTSTNILFANVKTYKKTGLLIKWNKVKNASGYEIYLEKYQNKKKNKAYKKVKTIKGNNTFSWKTKSLKKQTPYMIYVKAYVTKKGKKKYLQSSPRIFVFTGDTFKNYTNAKSITLKQTKLSLKKKKTFKIKAQINKIKKNKKLMPDTYVASIRYFSSNKKIASVDKKGKITAKGKGTCYIYIYSHNGITSKVKVTVK